jgi:hypothetical protein
MRPKGSEEHANEGTDSPHVEQGQVATHGGEEVKLRRWQVSFASGRGWYPVGEFVALDAKSAIDRAVDIFGSAADYLAEEIPWDAAPFHQAKKSPRL